MKVISRAGGGLSLTGKHAVEQMLGFISVSSWAFRSRSELAACKEQILIGQLHLLMPLPLHSLSPPLSLCWTDTSSPPITAGPQEARNQ